MEILKAPENLVLGGGMRYPQNFPHETGNGSVGGTPGKIIAGGHEPRQVGSAGAHLMHKPALACPGITAQAYDTSLTIAGIFYRGR